MKSYSCARLPHNFMQKIASGQRLNGKDTNKILWVLAARRWTSARTLVFLLASRSVYHTYRMVKHGEQELEGPSWVQ